MSELKEKQPVMGKPPLLCSELLSSKCWISTMGSMEEEQDRYLCLDFDNECSLAYCFYWSIVTHAMNLFCKRN